MEENVRDGWVNCYYGSVGDNVVINFENTETLYLPDCLRPVRITQQTKLKFNGFATTLSIVMSHLAAPTMKGQLGVWAKAVADESNDAITVEFAVRRR